MAVAAVVVVGLFVALAWSVLEHAVLHGEVTAQSLASSVAGSAGSSHQIFDRRPRCRPAGSTWRCTAFDGSGGLAEYRVRVRPGSSCWRGRLSTSGGEPMPEQIDGCVHVAD